MYGMGDAPMQQTPSQMSSVFQDPMEASAFSPVNMEKGGDIVVPKERMINDQPHELSYINPQEAGLLKALGGSGRRVDGIPAYFDTGMDNDFSEGTGESFSGDGLSDEDDSYQGAADYFDDGSSMFDNVGSYMGTQTSEEQAAAQQAAQDINDELADIRSDQQMNYEQYYGRSGDGRPSFTESGEFIYNRVDPSGQVGPITNKTIL